MPGFVRLAKIKPWINLDRSEFPFCLPVFETFEQLEFHPEVTFLIGENGSGKSTLMEAIATACGMPAEGGSRNHHFSTNDSHSDLGEKLDIGRNDYPKDTVFLRAETFYNLATYMLESSREVGGIPKMGMLHQRSHGEGFLDAMNSLEPHGLYLMDEPESALSIQGQLTFLLHMKTLVDQGCQFIIATHSPIILGFAPSWIYRFAPHGVERVEYKETDHYRITLDFLRNRAKYYHLLGLGNLED